MKKVYNCRKQCDITTRNNNITAEKIEIYQKLSNQIDKDTPRTIKKINRAKKVSSLNRFFKNRVRNMEKINNELDVAKELMSQ